MVWIPHDVPFKGFVEGIDAPRSGFQVRHDRKVGSSCSIKFMTDGILLRKTQCIVMVAMDKYSHDPRKDFRYSMVEMITANQIEAEQKYLDHHINYMMD
ncbi:hypothetical protein Sjap_019168 [Stephania japonica]|uniref:OVATE domain-containing protein n=1 Tax=Stephania japonica TaxID=461633 RepID=A0AAP0EYY0_9MAGN